MKKVRMRVLKDFSRRINGQIIVGDPDHPNEDGRILNVDEAVAVELEDADEAERYSHADQAREEAAAEAAADAARADGAHVADQPPKPETKAKDTLRPEKRQTSQEVREARTNTSGSGTGGRRPAPGRRGSGAKVGAVGGAPAGGNDTNATTNTAKTVVNGDGQTSTANAGVGEAPDPDAAPVT